GLECCVAALPNGKGNSGIPDEELVSPPRTKPSAQQRNCEFFPTERLAVFSRLLATGTRPQKPADGTKTAAPAAPSVSTGNAKVPLEALVPLPQRYAVAAAASPTVAAVVAGQARTIVPGASTSAKATEHVSANSAVAPSYHGIAAEQRAGRRAESGRGEQPPATQKDGPASAVPATAWRGNANAVTAVASGGGLVVKSARDKAKAQDSLKFMAAQPATQHGGGNQVQPLEQPPQQRQQRAALWAQQQRSPSRGRVASGNKAAAALPLQPPTAAAVAASGAMPGKPASTSAHQSNAPATAFTATTILSPKLTSAASQTAVNATPPPAATEPVPPATLSANYAAAKHPQAVPVGADPASNAAPSSAPQQPQPATQSFPASPASEHSPQTRSSTPDYVPRRTIALPPLPPPEPLPVSALPQSLADLAKGYEAAMQRSKLPVVTFRRYLVHITRRYGPHHKLNAKEDPLYIKQMLSMALQSAPDHVDGER
ncbi:MAG: hypothetical protein BJ554DRAFT_6816, partial [Olpidium bornovanus]